MAVATTHVSIAEVQSSHQDLISAEHARAAGDLDGAQRICLGLLDRHPDYVGALSMLALTHMQRDAHDQALPLLVKASMLNPKDWVSLTNAARAFLKLEAPECAIRYLEKSLMLKPDEHSTLFVLGQALMTTQRYERAAEVLRRACEAGSGESAAPFWLCECYLYLRRYDDAAEVLMQALRTPSNRDIQAYAYMLASSFPKDIKLGLDILGSLEGLGEPQPEDEEITQFNAAFTRGMCLERLGRHKEAWDCWVAANAPLKEKYEEQAQTHAKQEKELLSICLNWSPREKKPEKEVDKCPPSLFILGISRSGRAAMENLVGTLPGVEMLQEHDLATSSAQYVSQHAGLLTTYHLCKLPKELDPAIEETYRARLKICAGGAGLVTITHSSAIPDAGRLADFAPNTKFVFMRRSDDDVALRIFGQLYQENTNQYAYDLNAIYNHISNYRIMADNWLEKLGNQAILVNYEEMVSDPEAILQRVAKFCGLKPPSKPGLRIEDDSGCAGPYRKWLHAARDGGNSSREG